MDIAEHNRRAWNEAAIKECDWSIPVSAEQIDAAREGEWSVILTPRKPVPREWFPELQGAKVLCLASGGGQQAPILAAAGADVTSFDLSEEQLLLDDQLAEAHSLPLDTSQGDMRDLSSFDDGSFDLVFNPASNLFIPDVRPLWAECHRVLKPRGMLMSGSMNPSFFLFNHEQAEKEGVLEVKYPLPYSDLTSPHSEDDGPSTERSKTLEFGHTLEDLIGGQTECGFHITGFYEDYWSDDATPLNVYSPTSFATKAVKM